MRRTLIALATLALLACGTQPPLDEKLATELIRRNAIDNEPIYAEVPQRVWWGPGYPKDDYDDLAVRTLHNLERAGLLKVSHVVEKDGREIYQGKVTEKGFPIIGTVPSARGKAFRGKICVKKIDTIANFIHHPTDPMIGSAELIWHYASPTPLYDLFDTKIDKPLGKPFRSVASIRNEKGLWRVELAIRKAAIDPVPAPTAVMTQPSAAQPPR
ncbi:MAG: hypothetical protein WC538_04785 [Thermoanaerobaculia bacterium]|jgi:hypothetical protein